MTDNTFTGRRTVLKSLASGAVATSLMGTVTAKETGREIHISEVNGKIEVETTEIGAYRLHTLHNDDLQKYFVRDKQLFVLDQVLSSEDRKVFENNDRVVNANSLGPLQSHLLGQQSVAFPAVSTASDLRATEVVQSKHPITFPTASGIVHSDNSLSVSVGSNSMRLKPGEAQSIRLPSRLASLEFINPETGEKRFERVQVTPVLLGRNNGRIPLVRLQTERES